MLGEGEVTLTELVSYMINHGNKLPSIDILKKKPGIAFSENNLRMQSVSR